MNCLFEETQYFKRTWIWPVLVLSSLVPIGLLGVMLYLQFVVGKQPGNRSISNETLSWLAPASVFVMAIVVPILAFKMRLTVSLKQGDPARQYCGMEYRRV
jgi:hypothetical protein